jgi:hypothetical protein
MSPTEIADCRWTELSHMSKAELIFTALAEPSTRQIGESEQARRYSGIGSKLSLN